MNRSPNPTTKVSPEKLFTGKEPPPLFQGIPQGIPIPTRDEIDESKKSLRTPSKTRGAAQAEDDKAS